MSRTDSDHTKARVVEHTVASYDVTDNPETHEKSANVPEFRLHPKSKKGIVVLYLYRAWL